MGGMAFPTPGTPVQTAFSTSVTSMAVNMPATVNSGDLLIALVETRNAPTWTKPSGWNDIATIAQAGGGAVGKLNGFYKIAAGTEAGTTPTWTASTTTTAIWQTIRVTSWHGTTPPEATTSSGDSSNANPPSLTPSWGADDTLWITVAGNAATGETTGFTAAPTNYTGLQSNGASSGGSTANIATATRQLTATSDDPGTFTPSSNRFWTSATIGIRPASSVTPLSVKVSDSVVVNDAPLTAQKDVSALVGILGGTGGSGEDLQAIAQSFTAVGTKLRSVRLYLTQDSVSDNIRVDITSSIGGSSLGNVSVTGNTIPPFSFDLADYALTEFTFSSPITLVSGNTYYAQFTKTGTRDGSIYYILATDYDSYSGGDYYSKDNNSWTASGGAFDLTFSLLYADLKVEETSFINKSDSISVSDTLRDIIRGNTRDVRVSDTVTTSESTKIEENLAIQTSDSISVTEAKTLAIPLSLSVSDSVTVSENISTAIVTSGVTAAVSDAVSVTEQTAVNIPVLIRPQETVSVAESVSLSLSTSQIALNDTIATSEQTIVDIPFTASVSDMINRSESVRLTISDAGVVQSESIGVSESVKVEVNSDIAVSDNITTSESMSMSLAGVDPLFLSTSESLSVSDSVHTDLSYQIQILDTATVSESVGIFLVSDLHINDSVSVSESVTVSLPNALRITVSESIPVVDSPNIAHALQVQVSDTASITDTITMNEPHVVEVTPSTFIFVEGRICLLVVKSGIPHYIFL